MLLKETLNCYKSHEHNCTQEHSFLKKKSVDVNTMYLASYSLGVNTKVPECPSNPCCLLSPAHSSVTRPFSLSNSSKPNSFLRRPWLLQLCHSKTYRNRSLYLYPEKNRKRDNVQILASARPDLSLSSPAYYLCDPGQGAPFPWATVFMTINFM